METELKSLRIDRAQKIASGPSPQPIRWIAFALALSGSIGLALLVFRGLTTTTEVQVSRTKSSPTEHDSEPSSVLEATGYIVAAHKIEVASKVPGKVAWIGVEKGEKVKQGQVLVRLEDYEYRAQALQAQGNFDNLKAKLDELEHGSRPQEVSRASAEFQSATADLRNYQVTLVRTRVLVTQGILARQSLDDAQQKYEAQLGRVASLEQTYALTKLGPREEQIASMRAQGEQARGNLAYAKTQLDGTVIRAPVAGTILDRNVEKGEFVTTGFVGDRGAKGYVVSLADLSDLQVELDIDQNNFAKLRPAQPAVVTTDAYPDRKYTGRIVEISPQADRQKATVQIKVEIENPDSYLRPDMNASVAFQEEKTATANPRPAAQVVIPRSAVRDGSVFIVIGGRALRRQLVLQGAGANELTVSRGLAGGENLITNPPAGLKDGDRVRVR